MTSKERYKELIKENNQNISYLSDSYKRIAEAYTKKARGFGVKSLDTEVKIKQVLEELTTYDEKHLDVNIVIPNMTTYIENNIALISKAPSIKNKIKEIIAVIILILCFFGYFLLNQKCSNNVILNDIKEETVVITINSAANNSFYLTWEANDLASNGYTVIVYSGENKIKEFDVPKQVKDVSDDYPGTQYFQTDIVYVDGTIYTFEIYANATDNFGKSDSVKVTYDK